MNLFHNFLEGKFENKDQATKYPTRYAWIVIRHVKIGENRFYGQQSYHYLLDKPYRQFVIDTIETPEGFILRNYDILDKSKYIGCKNLDQISDNDLTYRPGCDIVLKYNQRDNLFEGGTSTCECYVTWRGKKTFLQNEISLGEHHYFVVDRGLDIDTKTQIWGSQYGQLKFYRV